MGVGGRATWAEEWGVVVGLVALAATLITLGVRCLVVPERTC